MNPSIPKVSLARELILKAEDDDTKVLIMNRAYFDHKKGLMSYAFFKVSDRSVGKDLVQDTFIKT